MPDRVLQRERQDKVEDEPGWSKTEHPEETVINQTHFLKWTGFQRLKKEDRHWHDPAWLGSKWQHCKWQAPYLGGGRCCHIQETLEDKKSLALFFINLYVLLSFLRFYFLY